MAQSLNTYDLQLTCEDETLAFGALIAQVLTRHRNDILTAGFNLRLTGDLGAGKTALTRAILRAMGVTGRVRSPTFELVEDYDVLDGLNVHHFDFYRFSSPVEFEEAGFRDLFGPGRITVCEWSEKAGSYLPAADINITLTILGLSRKAQCDSYSLLGQQCLQEIMPCKQHAVI